MRNYLIVLAIGIAVLAIAIYADAVPDDSVLDDEEDSEMEAGEEKPEKKDIKILGKDTPTYTVPNVSGKEYLAESFPSVESFDKSWISSKAESEDGGLKYQGKFKVDKPDTVIIKDDLGLVLPDAAKHYGITKNLDKMFKFTTDMLIVQYNVKFQQGLECGGAYVKLVSDETTFKPEQLDNETPYTIMFGPDKCGMDSKLHFILRHKNPSTGVYEEKHSKQPSDSIASYFTDKKTHLFTLVLKSDNKYTISIDGTVVTQGSLLEDLTPSINPSKRIPDPEDTKPEEWDEREKIEDEEAVKPEDWDESQPRKIVDSSAVKPSDWLSDESSLIDDADAVKPDDWDNDMDGEWEPRQIDNPACKEVSGCGEWNAPKIDNPLFKGIWKAPMIANPEYKGVWEPRIIDNPNYFEDQTPFNSLSSIQAVAFELWSMSGQIMFDDIIIADDQEQVDDFTKQTWTVKREQESFGSSYFGLSVWDVMKPHLWTIAGVVSFMVAAIVYFCMPKKTTKKSSDASAKKTDAVQADDDEEEVEDEEDRSSNVDAEGDGAEEGEAPAADEEEDTRSQASSSRTRRTKKDEEVNGEDLVKPAGDIITQQEKPKEIPMTTDDSGDGSTRHRKVQRDDLNAKNEDESVPSGSRAHDGNSKHRVTKD